MNSMTRRNPSPENVAQRGLAKDIAFDNLKLLEEMQEETELEIYEILDAALYNFKLRDITSTVVGAPAGYLSASIVDIDKDPSNLKTTGAILLGSVGELLLNKLSRKMFEKTIHKGNSAVEEKFADFEMGLLVSSYIGAVENLLDDLVVINEQILEIKQASSQDDPELMSSPEFSHLQKAVTELKDLHESYKTYSDVKTYVKVLSAAASAMHGYERHQDSWGYALVWGLLGYNSTVPLGVAFKQGFGERV